MFPCGNDFCSWLRRAAFRAALRRARCVAARQRIIASPTASSAPAAVCSFAPSGCKEDAIGTERKPNAVPAAAPWASSPGQRSLQLPAGALRRSSIYQEDARCLNQLFFFFIKAPPSPAPRMHKREWDCQNQPLFKLVPEVAEEGVASLVQPTVGSSNR